MNKREARLRETLELVRARGRVTVATVADRLSISEATVRRMFGDLEQQGLVIRIHGGVQLATLSSQPYSFDRSEPQRVEQKLAIALEAARYVSDGDRIFLDSGTTVRRLAECLAIALREGRLHAITVLTNSLAVAELLADECSVVLIGGEVRLNRRDVCGALSEKTLLRYRLRRAFLGADAIDIDAGYMTTDEQTASMNEIVIGRSEHSLVLADSQKLTRSSFVAYGSLAAVDALVTDWEIDPQDRARYEAAGASIITVARP